MSSRLEIRIPSELKSQVEDLAQKMNKSMSDVVREAIDLYMKLAENEMVELIKQAMKQPSEAKYLLEIEWWYRQGPSYRDEQRYEMIYGDVDVITVEEWSEPYPYRRGGKDIIVPKSIPVVVLVRRIDDTVDPPINEEHLWVFTRDGWKSVRVR